MRPYEVKKTMEKEEHYYQPDMLCLHCPERLTCRIGKGEVIKEEETSHNAFDGGIFEMSCRDCPERLTCGKRKEIDRIGNATTILGLLTVMACAFYLLYLSIVSCN